ncbi:MAG: hypothetical protein M1821_007737 [Bathelium mastoideum]|nr:MAG: hypothetical protein M1821_007737 [Bathelium mastoideum]
MALSRPVRVLGAVAVLLFIFTVAQIFRSPVRITPPTFGGVKEKPQDQEPWRDPNLDPFGEPPEPLWRVDGDNYSPNNPNSDRINATILSLVRNSELDDLLQSMRDLERTFNSKFNYPWTFFNDEPFSEEFKRRTSAETAAQVRYELIPKEHWEVPSWINMDLFEESANLLQEQDVQYAHMLSYHQMCRWNSGLFYKHPALAEYRYYWRVEPKVHFFCDIDYDVFHFMQDHNKTYGFTINLYDSPESLPSLWPETLKFLSSDANNKLLHSENAMPWLQDKDRRPKHNEKANGYSTCHFWSNFEIADMEFWRSEPYERYFEHLDRAGGFFYERWGDAPVHSIALGMFEDRSKIHW